MSIEDMVSWLHREHGNDLSPLGRDYTDAEIANALEAAEQRTDREPSDADFNRAAQTFYEASGLNLPHTSKPEVVAGVRAAWDALIAARNYREEN